MGSRLRHVSCIHVASSFLELAVASCVLVDFTKYCCAGLYLRSIGSVNLQSAVETVKSSLDAEDQSGWVTNPSDVKLGRIGIGVCRDEKNLEAVCLYVCVGVCLWCVCVTVCS